MGLQAAGPCPRDRIRVLTRAGPEQPDPGLFQGLQGQGRTQARHCVPTQHPCDPWKPCLLSGAGHGNTCGSQRVRRVSSPRSPHLLFAGSQSSPRNKTPSFPDHPHLSRAGDPAVSQGAPGIPVLGHRDSGGPDHGLGGGDTTLYWAPGRGRSDVSIMGSPQMGFSGRAVVTVPEAGKGHMPRAPHSSLWSGRHWGHSFSSKTPSGAHTQGSWVSHCHLASWVRS